MAALFQRTTALALLVWYVTLSAGGYGLHDLLGSCHAPHCHDGPLSEIHWSSFRLASQVHNPEKGVNELGSPRSATCCGMHSCRRLPRSANVPSAPPPTRDSSSGESTQPTSSDFLAWHGDQDLCPLCQWLGQLSLPTPFTPSVLDQALPIASSAHTVTLVIPPTWQPFAPRGPPANSEFTCAPSNNDWPSRVEGTDVQLAGSPFAKS